MFDNDGGIVQPTQPTEPKCKLNTSTKSDLGRKGKTELRVLDQEDLIRNVLSILHAVINWPIMPAYVCSYARPIMLKFFCQHNLPLHTVYASSSRLTCIKPQIDPKKVFQKF